MLRIILATNLIQSMFHHVRPIYNPTGVEASRSDRASPGEPCICNSTFYKSCPTDPHCKEDTKIESDFNIGQDNPRPSQLKNGISHSVARHTVADDYHDYDDPDHVEADLPIFGDELPSRQLQLSTLPKTKSLDMMPGRYPLVTGSIRSQVMAPQKGELVSDDEKKIVRHRKVYVKTGNDDPVIHPLRVTIPVEVEYPADIPTPKPLYKLKKYTTYEEKSEIKMVPVVKTIIKPANVTPDQFIE